MGMEVPRFPPEGRGGTPPGLVSPSFPLLLCFSGFSLGISPPGVCALCLQPTYLSLVPLPWTQGPGLPFGFLGERVSFLWGPKHFLDPGASQAFRKPPTDFVGGCTLFVALVQGVWLDSFLCFLSTFSISTGRFLTGFAFG